MRSSSDTDEASRVESEGVIWLSLQDSHSHPTRVKLVVMMSRVNDEQSRGVIADPMYLCAQIWCRGTSPICRHAPHIDRTPDPSRRTGRLAASRPSHGHLDTKYRKSRPAGGALIFSLETWQKRQPAQGTRVRETSLPIHRQNPRRVPSTRAAKRRLTNIGSCRDGVILHHSAADMSLLLHVEAQIPPSRTAGWGLSLASRATRPPVLQTAPVGESSHHPCPACDRRVATCLV